MSAPGDARASRDPRRVVGAEGERRVIAVGDAAPRNEREPLGASRERGDAGRARAVAARPAGTGAAGLCALALILAGASGCWNFDANYRKWCGDHPGECDGGAGEERDAGDGANDGGVEGDGGGGDAGPATDAGAEDAGATDGGSSCPETPDVVADWEDGGIWPFTKFQANDMAAQFHLADGGSGEPVRSGAFAGWFQVKAGDVVTGTSEERAMAVLDTGEKDGDEFFYGFSVYFPAGSTFTSTDSRYLVRWESDTPGVNGPLRVRAFQGTLQVVLAPTSTSGQRVLPLGPATTGVWHDVVLHVVWSQSTSGLVEAFHRAGGGEYVPATPALNGQTIEDATVMLHTDVGMSRNQNAVTETETVIHDGYRRGKSFCAVAP